MRQRNMIRGYYYQAENQEPWLLRALLPRHCPEDWTHQCISLIMASSFFTLLGCLTLLALPSQRWNFHFLYLALWPCVGAERSASPVCVKPYKCAFNHQDSKWAEETHLIDSSPCFHGHYAHSRYEERSPGQTSGLHHLLVLHHAMSARPPENKGQCFGQFACLLFSL